VYLSCPDHCLMPDSGFWGCLWLALLVLVWLNVVVALIPETTPCVMLVSQVIMVIVMIVHCLGCFLKYPPADPWYTSTSDVRVREVGCVCLCLSDSAWLVCTIILHLLPPWLLLCMPSVAYHKLVAQLLDFDCCSDLSIASRWYYVNWAIGLSRKI
jgi:archaellum biogenesis protein FlaJ (TadC family)